MSVKLLTEYYLVFLSLQGGSICWSDSTRVKMPHCWKLHVAAQICYILEVIITCDLTLNLYNGPS